MQLQLKLKQPLMILITGLLLGLQYNQPSRAYMILLIIFGGMFLMSYLWAWSLGMKIQFNRQTASNWVQVGDHIEEYLILSNRSFFPAPYIEFIDESTLPGFNASRITSISPRALDLWTVNAFCDQRGSFHLGDAYILTGDPLGIFEVILHASLQNPILVLPRPSILPELPIASSGMMGEGKPRRDASQQTMHVSSVREFAEGDSMRQIHWPTTARKNKTFVRLMENAPEGNWWIVLDLDQQYMLGTGWDSIEEQSVSLAASLADLGQRARKSTGLVSNGHAFGWHPPQKGDAGQWEILQTLALARPGNLSLAALLDKVSTSLGSHHSLLIITACTQTDWIKSLPSLAKRGLIPTVFLMDTSTFDDAEGMEIASLTLEKQGVRHHHIPRGLIKPPQMEPIPLDPSWDWNAVPAGSVVAGKNP